MNWIIGNRYRTLLFSLIALILLTPLFRSTPVSRFVLDLMTMIVFLVALWAMFESPKHRLIALLLGVPTMLGLWTGYLIPGAPRVPIAIAFHGLAALFFMFSIGTVLRTLYNERRISNDSIFGVFCGYLMTGLVFGNLYSILELAQPGSFLGDAFSKTETGDHHFLLTYFSFLTLTTVGYGDIVPASDSARGLAVIEAIFGQFYIAVLVAELIGRRSGQSSGRG